MQDNIAVTIENDYNRLLTDAERLEQAVEMCIFKSERNAQSILDRLVPGVTIKVDEDCTGTLFDQQGNKIASFEGYGVPLDNSAL